VDVAVVGVGGWGKNHVRVLRQLRGEGLVDTLYVVDVDEERLRWAERVYDAVPLKSIEDAVDRDIDAAIIATPTSLHYKHAKAFVESGISVLVEKPFTATVSEAESLYKAGGDVVITTGLLLRFHGAVRYVKQSMSKLGRVLSIYAKRTSHWPQRVGDLGVIKDLAIHDADLVTYITGARAREVIARGGSIRHSYEDHVQILASYDGFSAVLEANWVTPFRMRRMEITGEHGIFSIDFTTDTVILYTEDGAYMPRLTLEEPLLVQDREFLKAVEGKGGEIVPKEDVIYVIRFCEAAAASMRKSRTIGLEEV